MPPEIQLETALTPVMRQYQAAKQAHPDALVFFRLGDFYELFYEDAVTASRELQLTLTSRDKTKSVPMCGVPYHSAGTYLQRLLRLGYRVALCEQMEDAKTAKTIVRREVTRVLTPGTALDPALPAGASQWLASIVGVGTGAQACVGVALLDLSTGDFRATEFSGAHGWALALDEIARVQPAELLFASGNAGVQPARGGSAAQTVLLEASASATDTADTVHALSGVGLRTPLEDWVFTTDYAIPLLRQQLRVLSLDGMGLAGHDAAAVAAGVVVHYLRSTKQGALEHLDAVRFHERNECLELDAVSVRNLELVEPLFSAEGAQTTLLYTLDACSTPMGKRLLRAQLLRPMQSLKAIDARLDAVGAAGDLRLREELRRALDGILDLERLLGRIALDSAGPRDIAGFGTTLGRLPALHSAAHGLSSDATGRWAELCSSFDTLSDLAEDISATLADDPPVSLSDGGAVRAGVGCRTG